jgi:biopolymer transport protein ExbB
MTIAPLTIAEMPEALQSVTGFFTKGGLFMWPLLACSIVAVTTIILRTFALRAKNVLPITIEGEMERLVPGASPERLARIVHHDPSSLARIVRVALQHLRWPRAENADAVQTRARYEMVRLERGLVILEVIVGIAPLIGLIGTVSGLIHVFASLGLSAGAADAKRIALGISEALSTTIFGLGIAVPSLIAFVYFSKKVEVLSVEMESLVTDLLAKLYYGRVAPAAVSVQPGPPRSVTPSAAPSRAPVA